MNPPFDSRQRHTHEGGNPCKRHVVKKVQSQRHRIISRQTVQGLDHRLIPFFVGCGLCSGFDLCEQRRLQRHSFIHVRRFTFTKTQSSVTRYRRQPCCKLVWFVNRRQCL